MQRKKGGLLVSDVKGLNTQISDLFSGKNSHLWYDALDKVIKSGAVKAFGWESIGKIKFSDVDSYEDFVNFFDKKVSSVKFIIDEDALKIVEGWFTFHRASCYESEYIILSAAQMGIQEGISISELYCIGEDLGLTLCCAQDAAQIMLLDSSSIFSYILHSIESDSKMNSIIFPKDYGNQPIATQIVNNGSDTIRMCLKHSNVFYPMSEELKSQILTSRPFIVIPSYKFLFRMKKK